MKLPEPGAFPAELRDRSQWFCARFKSGKNGDVQKVPVNVRGYAIDATTPNGGWVDFKTAYAAAPRFDGLGFAIQEPHTFIDIDHCRDAVTGVVEQWALDIVGLFPGSYVEVSQSGTGIHIITCGKWPEDRGHFAYHVPGASHPKAHVEVYSNRRYCAMTGQLFEDLCTEIADGSEGLLALARQFSWGGESKAANGRLPGIRIPAGVNLRQELEARLKLRIITGAVTFYNYHGIPDAHGVPQPCLLAGVVHADNDKNKRCSAFAERDGYFWHTCFADDAASNGAKGLENLAPEDLLSKTRTAVLALDQRGNGTPPLYDRLCGGRAAEVLGPSDVVPVVEGMPITDMPEAVLDGRLGEIVAKCLLSLSPLAYAWPATLAVAGTIAHQGSFLRTNLFVALVGPVESGKSATVENAASALGMPEDAEELLRYMAGSAEGLLKRIGDANGAPLLYCPDELAHLFSKVQIENSSFASVLQRCFYQTSFELIIAKGHEVTFNASLGICGGIVDTKFEECFDATTTAGLYSRFIFGRCPHPFEFHFRPFENHAEEFPAPCAVSVQPEVWELKRDWMKQNPGLTGRTVENALRVASICASIDGRPALRSKDLAPALAFAQYQTRARALLEPNPGKNPDAICAWAILRKLQEVDPAGEKFASKREIGKAIHSERFGPGIFRRAGDSLVFNGEIERTFFGPEGKRKTELWRLCK